jgi:hypothetical protein
MWDLWLPSNGGNGDGILDARDAIWPSLRLWIDYNHDGISQPWEIFTLQDKGIVAIGLDYVASNKKDAYGNLFRYGSLLAIERDGAVRLRRFYDVYLVKH